ncbi:beta-glucanase [Faustovirus]|nr:beta-glucanase [Faustovirus]
MPRTSQHHGRDSNIAGASDGYRAWWNHFKLHSVYWKIPIFKSILNDKFDRIVCLEIEYFCGHGTWEELWAGTADDDDDLIA